MQKLPIRSGALVVALLFPFGAVACGGGGSSDDDSAADLAAFLGHQVAISAAADEAGC